MNVVQDALKLLLDYNMIRYLEGGGGGGGEGESVNFLLILFASWKTRFLFSHTPVGFLCSSPSLVNYSSLLRMASKMHLN